MRATSSSVTVRSSKAGGFVCPRVGSVASLILVSWRSIGVGCAAEWVAPQGRCKAGEFACLNIEFTHAASPITRKANPQRLVVQAKGADVIKQQSILLRQVPKITAVFVVLNETFARRADPKPVRSDTQGRDLGRRLNWKTDLLIGFKVKIQKEQIAGNGD